MEESRIIVRNCNCIKEAKINIKRNTLNIKYGPNGTGKTTISKAIENSNTEGLKLLTPYGCAEEPQIENNFFQKVKVYNEEYVNRYIFEQESFLNDSYRVFCKDEKYEQLLDKAKNMISNLYDLFNTSNLLNDLTTFAKQYLEITFFDNHKITGQGGMGDLQKGYGIGFDNHQELSSYKQFYNNRDYLQILKWAKWRNDGILQMIGSICPFCTNEIDVEKINEQNNKIKTVFKKSALDKVNEILELLDIGVKNGLIKESVKVEFETCLRDENKRDELIAALNGLGIESEYIVKKINKLKNFKPIDVTQEQLSSLENELENMRIEKQYIDRYYLTDDVAELIQKININIDKLCEKNRGIIALFTKCQEQIEKVIDENEKDINHFLNVAGFPYKFYIERQSGEKSISYLKPLNLDNSESIDHPENHLSWGEKNAFALVMFLFEAISEQPDLIILDDPITSFDKNKKFAIISRLFRNTETSFRNQTVLMLTHNLQPIIDFIYGNFLRKYDMHTPIFATYIWNEQGHIKEREISSSNLNNIVELCESIANNDSIDIPVRIVNLRKYIELINNDYVHNEGYNVISNIVHGRDINEFALKYDIEEEMSVNEYINIGIKQIQNHIKDISYEELFQATSDSALIDIMTKADIYSQIVAVRLLFEKNRGEVSLLKKLKKEYPGASKFINESYHIENDYIFQLDPTVFYEIPECYLKQISEFITNNKELLKI